MSAPGGLASRGRIPPGILQLVAVLVAASFLAPVAPAGVPSLGAQEPPADPANPFTFRGEVRDYLTESPIEGAIVQIAELKRSAVTDSNGYFEFPGLTPDRYTFVTGSFGYETNREASDIRYGAIMLVRLNPMAIELEGIEVRVERLLYQLEIRRVSTPTAVAAYDSTVMASSMSPNVATFVEGRAGLDTFVSPNDQYCMRSRGRNVRIRTYLDEVPVASAYLRNLGPRDVEMIEVYSGLAMVRVYSRQFLERAADQGFRPLPIDLFADAPRPC